MDATLEKSPAQLIEEGVDTPIDIQELAIVIVAKGTNPSLLTPDFFLYSGIIPRDWQLARDLIATPQVTQLVFQNGISVLVEPGKVTFSESISTKSVEEVSIAKMAAKFVETLPQADYQAVGINPKRIVTFNGQYKGEQADGEQPDGVQKYMTETLLAPGEWQHFGEAPLQASLNLSYQLNDGRFQLNISPTQLRLPNAEQIPGLLFAGNFHYEVVGETPDALQQRIQQVLGNWSSQLETYQSLLAEKFLPQAIAS
jgi:hypothetical protein